jgi:transcription antitermination factor NusG
MVCESEAVSAILGPEASGPSPWHVLWTRSHCEWLVHEQLAGRGFHPYVPEIDMWIQHRGSRQIARAPMFSGYLFLNDVLDKRAHVDVRKTRGLVQILGEAWDRPAVVPEADMRAIQTVAESRLPVLPHPYVREGERVRIVSGPLKDVEGVLVKVRQDKGLFVLSVSLLQRSVAIEVDCTSVVPAS